MLKSLVLGLLVTLGSFGVVDNGNVIESDTEQLDVFYMYSDDNGAYFLEPSSDTENVIWIGYEDLKLWNINVDELHHGNKFVGLFSADGWELIGLEYVK